jgi:hypothetical protein
MTGRTPATVCRGCLESELRLVGRPELVKFRCSGAAHSMIDWRRMQAFPSGQSQLRLPSRPSLELESLIHLPDLQEPARRVYRVMIPLCLVKSPRWLPVNGPGRYQYHRPIVPMPEMAMVLQDGHRGTRSCYSMARSTSRIDATSFQVLTECRNPQWKPEFRRQHRRPDETYPV